jgi:outer membrane lipoprotein carrier protein
MCYFLAFCLALFAPPMPSASPPQDKGLSDIVDGVERSFARMKDFSSDFTQIFEDSLNRKQQESGHLYLMRSRMMRWEYKSPEEKLFISDGKTVYFYVPADRQVNKEAVKNSFDDRIPLMFLLGQSSLHNEFTRFELLNAKPFFEGTKVVRMYPKTKTDLQEITMEVDPATYFIRRLLLAHSDGSRSEFIFSGIRTNTGLRASLFDFAVPPGVEVIQGLGQ